MTGRELSRRIGRSEKYVRDRLVDKFEFALNDVEAFCDYIGEQPEQLVSRAERAATIITAAVPMPADVTRLTEDEVRKRHLDTAANRDASAEELDPEL
jgi:hypothetical protein